MTDAGALKFDSSGPGADSAVAPATDAQPAADSSHNAPDQQVATADSTTPPSDSSVAATGSCGSAQVKALLAVINAARSSALACDDKLGAVALAHSNEMCKLGQLTNVGADGSTYAQRLAAAGFTGYVAELIAAGQTTGQAVFDTWNANPSAKQLLLGNYSHVGIGYVECPSGYPTYWTVDLHRR